MHFTIAEIAEIFAVMMAFAFLESLAVTLFLALLSAVLPAAWLRDGFALKGFVVISILAIASITFQYFLTSGYPSLVLLAGTCILPLIVIGLLIFEMRSQLRLQQFLATVQDRLSIMVYIYGPLGLLSLVFVMVHYLI